VGVDGDGLHASRSNGPRMPPGSSMRWLACRRRDGLQVGWLQTGVSGNAGQHSRPQLILVVKGEHVIRPTRAGEGPMRA
jgi:hypothetical protein